MTDRAPQLGDCVLYTLSASDAFQITEQRAPRAPAVERRAVPSLLPRGAPVAEGDVFPMTIVRVWLAGLGAVNGQVHLDGTDVLWVLSIPCGDGPRTWAWPPSP